VAVLDVGHREWLALDRLNDLAIANGGRRDPDANNFAINDALHLLQVRLELAAARPSDLLTDPAEVLSLTTVGLLVTEHHASARKYALLRHDPELRSQFRTHILSRRCDPARAQHGFSKE
jgi:hypothetical protein